MGAPHRGHLGDLDTYMALSSKSEPCGVDIQEINGTLLIDIREQYNHETHSTSKSESGR